MNLPKGGGPSHECTTYFSPDTQNAHLETCYRGCHCPELPKNRHAVRPGRLIPAFTPSSPTGLETYPLPK